jgi:hypothetical protein
VVLVLVLVLVEEMGACFTSTSAEVEVACDRRARVE